MYFTQEDYEKIEKWLLQNTAKDTDFPEATLPLQGDEILAFVQNDQNVKGSLKNIADQFLLLGVSDFLNVTYRYNQKFLTIEEAAALIPTEDRKVGQVLTFINATGKWSTFQYQGTDIANWEDMTLWVDIVDNITTVYWNDIVGKPDFATVATSGSYLDLTDTPRLSEVATSGNYRDLIGTPDLAVVATSGSYNDLKDRPVIPPPYTLPIATTTKIGGVKIGSGLLIGLDGTLSTESISWGDVTGKPTFSVVATSGSYNDLTDKPTIPPPYTLPQASSTVLGGIKLGSGLSMDAGGVTSVSEINWGDIAGKPSFAAVATSGDYNDLLNKPDIPLPYTLPKATTSALGGIRVGGILFGDSFSVSYPGKLRGSPIEYLYVTIPYSSLTENGLMSKLMFTKLDGIQPGANYYELPVASGSVLGGVKAGAGVTIGIDGTLGVSVNYDDIIGKPTLATVATTGSYNDLLNKPVIPPEYTLPISDYEVLGGIKTNSQTVKSETSSFYWARVMTESNGYANAMIPFATPSSSGLIKATDYAKLASLEVETGTSILSKLNTLPTINFTKRLSTTENMVVYGSLQLGPTVYGVVGGNTSASITTDSPTGYAYLRLSSADTIWDVAVNQNEGDFIQFRPRGVSAVLTLSNTGNLDLKSGKLSANGFVAVSSEPSMIMNKIVLGNTDASWGHTVIATNGDSADPAVRHRILMGGTTQEVAMWDMINLPNPLSLNSGISYTMDSGSLQDNVTPGTIWIPAASTTSVQGCPFTGEDVYIITFGGAPVGGNEAGLRMIAYGSKTAGKMATTTFTDGSWNPWQYMTFSATAPAAMSLMSEVASVGSAVADLAYDSDLSTVISSFNQLLSSLREAGVIKT